MMHSAAWLVATVVGLVVGGFVFHFPGSFGEATWQPGAIAFGAILGGINGLLVGLLQWLGLGLSWAVGSRLMLAMGIGVGASHGLADGSPSAVGLATIAVLGSVILGLAFGAILGLRDRPTLAASFIGWAAGWLLAVQVTRWLGLPSEQTPIGWATEHAVVGLVVGLVWGLATAFAGFPARLRRRSASTIRRASDPI